MKILCSSAALVFLLFAGPARLPELQVPQCTAPFGIDGQLNEKAYTDTPPLTAFAVAGEPNRPTPKTAAWVFWDRDALVFAFDCDDTTPVALRPSADERAVDGQDRVELFLWSGDPDDTYYCMEIAALGAVHDYRARFYRRFDSTWSVPDWKFAVSQRDGGYVVEASLGRQSLESCGFRLRRGSKFRAGLFRADFQTPEPNREPTWITWVDARTPQPDFHVAGSFGRFRLVQP